MIHINVEIFLYYATYCVLASSSKLLKNLISFKKSSPSLKKSIFARLVEKSTLIAFNLKQYLPIKQFCKFSLLFH